MSVSVNKWRVMGASAMGYIRRGGVSPVQSILKHSLVPVDILKECLPVNGVITDCGCGEGMLANLVASLWPGLRVIGIDLDKQRISIAGKNACQNAEFHAGDFSDDGLNMQVDAAIFNDVLHHHPYQRHAALIESMVRRMKAGGTIIIKEVDQSDRADKQWTRFFDSRLYPKDTLCFRTAEEWSMLLQRLGLTDIGVRRFRHPWPASRTIIFGKCPAGGPRIQSPECIGRENLAAQATHTNVFLTGATGFIGSHVAEHLLDKGLDGKEVRLLFLCRSPDRISAELKRENAVPLFGELDDLPRLKDALQGVDYVFHLAAEVKFFGGADVWRHNHEGTVSLLKALAGVPLKRLIHASTIGVMDRTPEDPCNRPLSESDPFNPLSEYGKAKLAAERAVHESGIKNVAVRIPWAYGPRMTPDTHVRNLMEAVAKRKLYTRFNFPGRVSIIAVKDLVRALVFVAESAEASGNVYFATDGRPVSLGHLLWMMGDLVGQPAGQIRIPSMASRLARILRRFLPLAVQNLNSDVLCADGSRLFELGFKPEVSQRDGLRVLAESLGLYQGKVTGGSRLVSVVTGAASGIGEAVSRQLAAEGHSLLLVDRNAEALDQLASHLHAEALCLDLTGHDALDKLKTFIATKQLALDWVVNNAGVGCRGLMVETPLAKQQTVIDLNCSASTGVCHLALSHFEASGKGTLVNIISSSAFQPLPYMAVYAASKAYGLSLSRAITAEMKRVKGVHILTVCPSGTATQFQVASGVKVNPREKLLSPDKVAQHIISAARCGRPEITIGTSARLMELLARILPSAAQRNLWLVLMSRMR